MSLLDIEDNIEIKHIDLQSLKEIGFFESRYSTAAGIHYLTLCLTFTHKFIFPKASYLYIYLNENDPDGTYIRFDCCELYGLKSNKYSKEVRTMYDKYKEWIKIKYIDDIYMVYHTIRNTLKVDNCQLLVTRTMQEL